MTPPVLSVVVPTHNVLPWIDQTIDSLLDQDVDLEVVLVDDASTDGTWDYLCERASMDPRLTVLAAELDGGANARNQGVRSARGEYLAFADGDDLVPRGAYAAMLRSLDASGSEMAVGDFLKFGASRTWRPTARWPDYQQPRQGARLEEVPSIIRGRACWNRVFRAAFWRRLDLHFPEVPRSNDIQPMTRALVSARSIDVVDEVVYLYRDRPGQTSMSYSAGADRSAQSYFEQEVACARMVTAHGSVELAEAYSALVFDSDTWVHLSRYLLQLPPADVMPAAVNEALQGLMQAAPRNSLNNAAAHRRALFLLLEVGRPDLAQRFNLWTGVDRPGGASALCVWAETSAVLLDAAPVDLDIPKFLQDGILTQLVDHARGASDTDLLETLQLLTEPVLVTLGSSAAQIESSVIRAMAQATVRRDVRSIRQLSVIQGHAPLVVDHIRPGRRALRLHGTMPAVIAPTGPQFVVIAQETGQGMHVGCRDVDFDRFEVIVRAVDLPQGRYEVRVNVRVADGINVEFAVVTARMPIPTLNSTFALQALSDRRRSWRLIVDRRPSLAARLVRTATNRVRSLGEGR